MRGWRLPRWIGKDARVALAEVDVGEEGGLGFATLGRLGEFEEESVAADLERWRVEALRLRFAPVPDGVEHAEAGTAKAFAAADAPVVVGGGREALAAGGNLRAALLLEPLGAAEAHEFAQEDVAEGGQVPDVERGVGEQFRRDGTLGPVGFLAVLVERDAKMLLEERGEADAVAAEELRRQHGVEDAFRPEAAEVVQQAQIEIAPVHDEVLVREHAPQRVEFHARREHIDEEDVAVDQELEQADARLVVIHVVRLRIEGDFVYTFEGRKQRRKRTGLVEELVDGRARGHFNTEETAQARRKKT